MTQHPHHAAMADYARDAAETDKPWERWENLVYGKWVQFTVNHPPWLPEIQYRRKRRMIIVNGVKVPAPETENLKLGTEYYTPCPSMEDRPNSEVWNCDGHDKRWLSLGLVYLNESDAIERAKAMLITTPYE